MKRYQTADLCDAMPAGLQICRAPLRNYGGQTHCAGVIATVQCQRANGLVRKTLTQAGRGQVLVVDGGGIEDCALVGDKLARLALDNGYGGLIVYGAVRDTEELQNMPVGVWALAIFPQRGEPSDAGQSGVTVRFGGATFAAGHWVCADADGIVVLPEAP